MTARRIRVAYLIDRLQRAGAQAHLGQLVPRLDPAAFEPEVLCLLAGGPVAEEMKARGVKTGTVHTFDGGYRVA